MIRQPFTEFIRGISRANMTAMYEMQTFNTYSRYIQDQRDCHMPYTKRTPSIHTRDISRYRRDCHMPYTMRQPFNELLGGISSPTWLPYTLQWASTRHIQGQCDYANPSMSFYEVYPVQRDYANPSLSFYEVYPGPMWLGKPKYDLPTLHWVSTRYIQIPTSRMSLWRYANIQWDTPTFNDFYTRRTRRGIPKANVTAIHDTPTFNFMANVGVIYLTPTFNEL